MSAYALLEQRLRDLHNLNMAYWLLDWDQNTHMPPLGASARAQHMATLKKIRHEMLTADETARLIEDAERETADQDPASFAASLVRVARQDYDEAIALPAAFVQAFTAATYEARARWIEAKAQADYQHFLPALQKVFDLKLREASLKGDSEHPYDHFLSRWERGITTAQARAIFDEQRPQLVELVQVAQLNAEAVDDRFLHQAFSIDQQRALSRFASRVFGFDYDQWATFDTAPHPFCLQIAVDDIRLTTRFNPHFFNPAFFGTLHETGHGLHGRGFARELDGTFLSDMESFSHAVCESQSRTWENMVGRSRPFWEWFMPIAQEHFPAQLGDISAAQMYQAVNKVRAQPSRVEADEVTYNLHVILRMELEIELVEGKLTLEEANTAWADRTEAYFGVRPRDDAEGILQDIHWSLGGMGAFVGYALGNTLAAQIMEVARRDLPDLDAQWRQGDFAPLRHWLTEHIYQHGRKYEPEDLTRRVTGESLNSRAYLAYLRQKVSDVYGL